MIKQAHLISTSDTEEKYKVSLSIASRRLTLEEVKGRIQKYMAAHHKKTNETSFIRNFDAATVTYAIAPSKKKPAAKKEPAVKKEAPKKPAAKKENKQPLSRPAAKKPAKKSPADLQIDYKASQRTVDGEKIYVVINDNTKEVLNHKTGKFQKKLNTNTCSFSSRHFAEKAIEKHQEENK